MAIDGREVAEGAKDTMRQVQAKATERFEDVRGYAGSAESAIREFAREKPMVAVACAIGVGFLIGRLASKA
jgi:ElaB/YqjD/DUF883 family membrane-anchored ribosome-binding protein